MHIHILGICGTFMGGIALLAREMGFEVSGSDANVYPPMSTQLERAGITLQEGYRPEHLQNEPDLVVIGNALSRGNPALEYVLEHGMTYTSGPAFLADVILPSRWVLAVSGTHGKTSTSSMLAWILEHCGMKPGFLVGGIPANFGKSARLGSHPFFVVEADEYDTAFFDKRAKFVHYRPRTLVINNLEYDHADIFPDLAAIQRQFHHLVRTVPANGLIVHPAGDAAIEETLAMGCWTPREPIGKPEGWHTRREDADGSAFDVYYGDTWHGRVEWDHIGMHNVRNALAAIAAARHAGIDAGHAVKAMGRYAGVSRRMEIRGKARGITVYDDFAHHPTAIAATLGALRARVDNERIVAVLEPRSNTMRMGVHRDQLPEALRAADEVLIHQAPQMKWDASGLVQAIGPKARAFTDTAAIIDHIHRTARPGDHVLIMSNGGFENIHARLLESLDNVGT